jgi:MFS family permease
MATLLSTQDYASYLRKNATWNFVVNTLDLTFYHLAVSFIFGSTILTLYASHLTDSAALIGLIPAIQSVGYFLPQLLVARRSEQLWRRKPFVQKISVMERLPYLFVTLCILLWPGAPTWFSFSLLALSLALATLSGGLAGPAWNDLIATVIPAERRGFFFGLSQATGGLLGIGGAALSRYFLANYPYPTSFGICFLLCFISQVFSWVALTLNREPARAPTKAALSTREYWRRLPEMLRHNPNFSRYLVGRWFIILGGMAGPFYVLYARRAFGIPDAFAAGLTITTLVTQTVATPFLGWLADRWGRKWLTELGALAIIGTIALAFFASGPSWFYGIFALMSVSGSGLAVAGMSMVMDFGSHDDIPTIVALSSTVLAVPVLVAPVLGGWLADAFGYRILFGTALVMALTGWATMRWAVKEPREVRRQKEADAVG